MPPSEAERTTAREWLQRAKGNLARARPPKPTEAFWEDLCFDAQQAAEKAVKAVLLWRDIVFPYVHDLDALLKTCEQAGYLVPDELWAADDLSRYATETRYPGIAEPVTQDEHKQAVALAELVVSWAESVIEATLSQNSC